MELGSQEDNNKDAKSKGRSKGLKNEDHNLAVLTNEQARQIRLFHGHGWSRKEIAEMFGVTTTVANRVISYKTYVGV
jgi:DNA-directed RNA polymerase specialized sigma24 family protein